jgi:hypothetical protein
MMNIFSFCHYIRVRIWRPVAVLLVGQMKAHPTLCKMCFGVKYPKFTLRQMSKLRMPKTTSIRVNSTRTILISYKCTSLYGHAVIHYTRQVHSCLGFFFGKKQDMQLLLPCYQKLNCKLVLMQYDNDKIMSQQRRYIFYR